jgi:septum site-determining protein MinC
MTIARQNDKTSPAFELKGSALTLMVLYLFTVDRERFNAQLQTKFASAAGFFRNAPLLIDVSTLSANSPEAELAPLIAQLRTLGLVPVALRGGSSALQEQALAAGLGLLPALRGEASLRELPEAPATIDELPPDLAAAEEEATPPAPAAEPSPLPVVAVGTKVVTRTIRSGQRIVAATGDLLVLGAVNAGAEILAAGNIHVYGPLRGRALAGIHGDSGARICALQFYPELVAIAGEYLLHDEFDPAQLGGAVVVTIAEEKLKIETIGAFTPSHA